MPRVHQVKKAQKDYPEKGIKKGESYYWWAFRYGGKHMSKTYPKASQLTQSDFLSSYYSTQESFDAAISDFGEIDDLISACEEAKSELEQLQSDCEDKVSNLENAFPGGSPTIDLIQARAENCESTMGELDDAISTLEEIKSRFEENDDETFEVGDLVTYHEDEYKVTEVDEDPTIGGQRITIKPTSEESESIRLSPGMLKEEDKVEKVKDEDEWRQEAEDAVSGINWDAE